MPSTSSPSPLLHLQPRILIDIASLDEDGSSGLTTAYEASTVMMALVSLFSHVRQLIDMNDDEVLMMQ